MAEQSSFIGILDQMALDDGELPGPKPRQKRRRGGARKATQGPAGITIGQRILKEQPEQELSTAQREVLSLFAPNGWPISDADLCRLAHAAGIQQTDSGIRTRRAELVDLGYITDSGERETTENGRQAVRWKRS